MSNDDDGVVLAKQAIDVGLMTNAWPGYEGRLSELSVQYDHLLKVGGGVHQHRFLVGESVVKINSHRAELEQSPSTLVGLRLVGRRAAAWMTPDGVPIQIVAPGTDDLVDVEVRWATPDPSGVHDFLVEGLGARRFGDRYRLGTSWFVVEERSGSMPVADLDGAGFRYLTVQIRDVEREHRRLLGLGFDEGRPPVRLGDTACISFVRAPDGTWVELSQRASLTGPLPALRS